MEISGCKVIVTGAAGGIGRAIVHDLLEHGAAKVGLLVRKKEQLEDLVRELAGQYAENRLVQMFVDVREHERLQEVFAMFVEEAGSIDVLVNNAAILKDGAVCAFSFQGIKRYPLKIWRETVDSNLTGSFLCSQLTAEAMIKKRTKGLILNISSVSRLGRAGQSAYSSTKGAIASLTFTLAQELAPYGIRCCSIAPGLVDTPMAMSIPEPYRKEMLDHVAVSRMGKPQEIAHAVRFCVENEFFNGRILEIDGGAFG